MTDKKWEDRQTKRIPLPPTEQELRDYQEWKDNYNEVHEQGFERGWLVYGYEGEEVEGPKPSGYEERPETDEEYESRINDPVARHYWNTIREMQKSIKKQIERESETLKAMTRLANEPGSGKTHITFPVVKRGDR